MYKDIREIFTGMTKHMHLKVVQNTSECVRFVDGYCFRIFSLLSDVQWGVQAVLLLFGQTAVMDMGGYVIFLGESALDFGRSSFRRERSIWVELYLAWVELYLTRVEL